jgi:iron complex transport system permease protein
MTDRILHAPTTAIPSSRNVHRRPGRAAVGVLTALLVVMVIAAAGTGAVPIAPGQVLAILGERVGLALPWAFEPQQANVLVAIRLPRVLLGVLVGAALATAGAALQGLFRNPLADPGLVGVTNGAALAAAAMIVVGHGGLPGPAWQALRPFALPLAAFAGGLLTTLVVYRIARFGPHTVVATMLLAGVALNALAAAGTGFLTFVASDEQLRSITFWYLGSLGGTTWQALVVAGPLLALALAVILRTARPLNALLLGEDEAGHVGVEVDRVKRILVVATALAVGAAVSVAGAIGFVGLVTPHLLRLSIGPDHRTLLPAAAALGATLLLGADLVARTVVAPAELPIGIVTAGLGAPFFLWLLLRDRRRTWAL